MLNAAPPAQVGEAVEGPPTSSSGFAKRDMTLEDPRSVFQLVKKHYSRYTPEMVSKICGIPEKQFLEMAETLIANSGRERTTMLA